MNFEEALEEFRCDNMYHLQWINLHLLTADQNPSVWSSCPFTRNQYPSKPGRMTFPEFVKAIIDKVKSFKMYLERRGA